MTWNTFKAYFDPHTWERIPSMRAERCVVCTDPPTHTDLMILKALFEATRQ